MTRAIGSVSGGLGSWSAVRRYVDQHGADALTLVFTDTLCEDQDTYRFMIAGAANLFGVTLPEGFLPDIVDFPAWEDRVAYKAFVQALASRTMTLLPQMQWLSDGRDPWDVYKDERFLGNSRLDPCSKLLKRKVFARWLVEHCDPVDTVLIFGIDVEETQRFDDGNGRGIRPRYAAMGWHALAPLCDQPWTSEIDRRRRACAEGLWVQRLSILGFAHSNCGGHCCKGGHAHWRHLLRTFPERYAYVERREQDLRALLGDVAMLAESRGAKRPLTLAELRKRSPDPCDVFDFGGCGCFFGDAA